MAIPYTRYEARSGVGPGPLRIDETRLEETNVGALAPDLVDFLSIFAPQAIDDVDGDGFIDVDPSGVPDALEQWSVESGRMPLATYFADAPSEPNSPHRFISHETTPVDFATIFTQSHASLPSLAAPLARYLASVAVHSGHNVDDRVPLTTSSGFSVTRDGRLRLDCVLFAQLAYATLQDFPGLQFAYIRLRRSETSAPDHLVSLPLIHRMSPQASSPLLSGLATFAYGTTSEQVTIPAANDGHLLLLISHGQDEHLVVSNHEVTVLHHDDPSTIIHRLYPEYPVQECTDTIR